MGGWMFFNINYQFILFLTWPRGSQLQLLGDLILRKTLYDRRHRVELWVKFLLEVKNNEDEGTSD